MLSWSIGPSTRCAVRTIAAPIVLAMTRSSTAVILRSGASGLALPPPNMQSIKRASQVVIKAHDCDVLIGESEKHEMACRNLIGRELEEA